VDPREAEEVLALLLRERALVPVEEALHVLLVPVGEALPRVRVRRAARLAHFAFPVLFLPARKKRRFFLV
jgi:hypothetical protein